MCEQGTALSTSLDLTLERRCRRLSLTPLCYLWQRDQAELMDEMVAAGMEAILIKVAGIGLTVKHLGKTLAQMQPTLVKLVRVCPENLTSINRVRTICMGPTSVEKEVNTRR
jgi:diphthamide synthase (EF-2-diphthine--ammonia ligase)